jgi:hypothetical protein
MSFYKQDRSCHAEHCEEFVSPGAEILRCAQNDKIRIRGEQGILMSSA